MTTGPRALYLCYFGLTEPLVQTQVLPYLREIACGGTPISLLTFEPQMKTRWSPAAIEEQRQRLRDEGIDWHLLPYHKRPTLPATLYDIVAGAFRAGRIARREKIAIFHGRSHVGAAIGALAKKMAGGHLIFDVRGFLADEYVDAGNWPAGGYLYRLTKAVEQWLYRAADGFVVLTESARATLFPNGTGRRPIEVIPCCVAPERFAAGDRDAAREELGLTDRLVFVYIGSLGGYYLVRETAEFLATAREEDPRVFALVLTQGSTTAMAKELERCGFSRDDYRVLRAPAEEVPRYLCAADVALSLIRPSYARRASSPTKFAEYLAAGLPMVATAGIGDLDAQIEEGRVGVLLHKLDRIAYAEAFHAVEELRRDADLAERCRNMARTRYDLRSVGGVRYRRLYAQVGKPVPRLRVLALASYPVEAASSRYRIVQFIDPLAERGVDVTFSPLLDSSLFASLYKPRKLLLRLPHVALRTLGRIGAVLRAARADVVWVQREAMLFGPPVIEWLTTRLLRRPLVLDLDDATWIPYESPVYGRLATLLKWPSKTGRLIRWSRTVTCGNPNIAAYVSARGAEAAVMPAIVDTRVFHPGERRTGIPMIGWIGTHGTYPFFERLLPLFERLAREATFRLTVVGSGREEVRVPGVAVDNRPWRMEREAEDFRSLDIGVYPMPDDAWNAGKSGLKAVQYMASGVPFVMSPVGVCATMGISGETHLAAVTDDQWLDALRRLITDDNLRIRIGRTGRAFAEQHYSIDEQADALAGIIRAAAAP